MRLLRSAFGLAIHTTQIGLSVVLAGGGSGVWWGLSTMAGAENRVLSRGFPKSGEHTEPGAEQDTEVQ